MDNRIAELELENSRLQLLIVELLFKNQRLRDTQSSAKSAPAASSINGDNHTPQDPDRPVR
jgi:hypothetical protein